MDAHSDLEQLTKLLAKLPGVGTRSSRRMVLHLLKHRNTLMQPLIQSMDATLQSAKECTECGNIDLQSPCTICIHPKRDQSLICIVEEVADLWAIERSQLFQGIYHSLGGTLSAIEGRGPDDLAIKSLINKVNNGTIREVILATNATPEGQTTAHYITEKLKVFDIKITRLAQGIPVGGELDYIDAGTLNTALQLRKPF